MLVVKSFGGLGNQIFQYLFYEYLKLDNDDVYFDISDFKVHNHHYGFELDKVFNVDFDIPSKNLNNIHYNDLSFFYRIFCKLFDAELTKKNEFVERTGALVLNRTSFKRDLYFKGFWQNSHYVKECSHVKLHFKNKLSGKNRELLERLKDCDTVSLHIRGGDYINNSSLGAVCTKKYYREAISHIKKQISSPVFLVFSDDVEYARTILADEGQVNYVTWNTGEDSSKDMQLMASCKHNIIANSSFSWWAAWLNPNPRKKVVMPAIWFNGQSYNPLKVDGWLTL